MWVASGHILNIQTLTCATGSSRERRERPARLLLLEGDGARVKRYATGESCVLITNELSVRPAAIVSRTSCSEFAPPNFFGSRRASPPPFCNSGPLATLARVVLSSFLVVSVPAQKGSAYRRAEKCYRSAQIRDRSGTHQECYSLVCDCRTAHRSTNWIRCCSKAGRSASTLEATWNAASGSDPAP